MATESRGILGTLFKWMFIAFNIMMAIMVYMSVGHTEESNTAVQVGDTYTYDNFASYKKEKYYAVFSYDDVPNFSEPATITYNPLEKY